LKIGLLGGSFNPAHEGHFHISEVALKRLGLDYVWWLVSPQNPLKPTIGMAPLCHRVEWSQDEARDPRIRVVDLETQLGTRYTIDTLRALKQRFADVRFVWLMGSDNLDSFRHWRRWPEIFESVPIAVIVRPGAALAGVRAKAAQRFSAVRLADTDARNIAFAKPPAFVVVDGPRSAARSTDIRARSDWGQDLVRVFPA
jgi:nicotinate-nucleotide adenylyltransferase